MLWTYMCGYSCCEFRIKLNMYQRDAGGGVRLMRVYILPLCLFIYFPFFWMYSTAQIQKNIYPHKYVCFFIGTLNQ
jgi:hypothetical protein